MPPLVLLKFLASAKAGWTYVNTFVVGTHRIRAFDADSVREVTCACIALISYSWLVNRYGGTRSRVSNFARYRKSMGITLDFVGDVLGLPLGNGHLSN